MCLRQGSGRGGLAYEPGASATPTQPLPPMRPGEGAPRTRAGKLPAGGQPGDTGLIAASRMPAALHPGWATAGAAAHRALVEELRAAAVLLPADAVPLLCEDLQLELLAMPANRGLCDLLANVSDGPHWLQRCG